MAPFYSPGARMKKNFNLNFFDLISQNNTSGTVVKEF